MGESIGERVNDEITSSAKSVCPILLKETIGFGKEGNLKSPKPSLPPLVDEIFAMVEASKMFLSSACHFFGWCAR